jgi:hypothetical protein
LLAIAGARFVAYVPLPDQKAIEQLILEKKNNTEPKPKYRERNQTD